MENTLTNKQYEKYVERVSPKSKLGRNVARAFVVGGLICVVGQVIMNLLKSLGLGKETVSNLTSMILIFLGILFTALNIYDELGRWAGAGSIVPITGFANSIVSPAMEFKREGYVMGVGAKMFVVAGPVIVYGTLASVVAGIIYFLIRGVA